MGNEFWLFVNVINLLKIFHFESLVNVLLMNFIGEKKYVWSIWMNFFREIWMMFWYYFASLANFSTLRCIWCWNICSDINIIKYSNCFDPFIKRPFVSLIEGFIIARKGDESTCSNKYNAIWVQISFRIPLNYGWSLIKVNGSENDIKMMFLLLINRLALPIVCADLKHAFNSKICGHQRNIHILLKCSSANSFNDDTKQNKYTLVKCRIKAFTGFIKFWQHQSSRKVMEAEHPYTYLFMKSFNS